MIGLQGDTATQTAA